MERAFCFLFLPCIVLLLVGHLLLLALPCLCATDGSDLAVLLAILGNVTNPGKLPNWVGTDPCGTQWSYVICSGSKVTQLQFGGAGLVGKLPSNLNGLSNLEQIALQGNSFSGNLPTFRGLTNLLTAYLGDQQFTSIPADFFNGVTSLTILNLERNPLNSSKGWSLPDDISHALWLQTLILTGTHLTGSIPSFLGSMPSLKELRLAYNQLNGSIPASFSGSSFVRLELNNQVLPSTLSGRIDMVGAMPSLQVLWLHQNAFSGTIPPSLGLAASIQEVRLNNNKLVGPIPSTFSTSSSLRYLSVQNNMLDGSIPAIPSITNSSNYTYSGNYFCQSSVGIPCAPQVNTLLTFLSSLYYPSSLVQWWVGNDPCSWHGIICDTGKENVTIINLPSANLSGTISSDLANLTFLTKLILNNNNLTGTIPESLTTLHYLVLVDVSNNNLYGPIPTFNSTQVQLNTSGNPNIDRSLQPAPSSVGQPPTAGTSEETPKEGRRKMVPFGVIAGAVLGVIALLFLIAGIAFARHMFLSSVERAHVLEDGGEGSAKIDGDVISNQSSGGTQAIHNNNAVLQASDQVDNLRISIQLLRIATNHFSQDNMIGEGSFGVVYEGELHDGTKIAVKRMQASQSSSKGLDEFQAEISVFTKVRHRNLVTLLGYCIEGNERLLVYEYLPLGTLSKHLFDWKELSLPPLNWEKRLMIALDVARGVEYLHGLAHKSFIHRDLKPSNILLGNDYRAKVSDFGLVKLAPEGKVSFETRLAGTFGYLAPEYAATGRVTRKADVYSFGVVLMELITGRKALDKIDQAEERVHLVTLFKTLIADKEKFKSKGIDPIMEVSQESLQSIWVVAELAGHCAVQDPNRRPEMSHAVNTLSPLVNRWKPAAVETTDKEDFDVDMSLSEALKKWQAFEESSISSDYFEIGKSLAMGSAQPRSSCVHMGSDQHKSACVPTNSNQPESTCVSACSGHLEVAHVLMGSNHQEAAHVSMDSDPHEAACAPASSNQPDSACATSGSDHSDAARAPMDSDQPDIAAHIHMVSNQPEFAAQAPAACPDQPKAARVSTGSDHPEAAVFVSKDCDQTELAAHDSEVSKPACRAEVSDADEDRYNILERDGCVTAIYTESIHMNLSSEPTSVQATMQLSSICEVPQVLLEALQS